MSTKTGMKKTWKRERARRQRAWKNMQKSTPPGGGSKYAKKKAKEGA
jgi:hypothetical protein